MASTHECKGKIQTVNGLLEPDRLGPTLIHEHVLCDFTPPAQTESDEKEVEISLENVWEIRYHWNKHLGNSRLDQEDIAIKELKLIGELKGLSLVELSNIGTRRNPLGLQRIAKEANVNIIMGCGYYIEEFLSPQMREESIEEMAKLMITDIVRGVDGSDVRSGIIGEIGCSYPWTEMEKRVMRAALISQQETGSTISIHPGRHFGAPYDILQFIREAGGDPTRTIMGHLDRTVFDKDTLSRLADQGCTLEYDFFGIDSSYYPFQEVDLPNDGTRLSLIRFLINRGHLAQILISHDICTKTRLVSYGGHGYGHIFRNIVPMMKRKGFTETEIDALLIINPRRLLTFN